MVQTREQIVQLLARHRDKIKSFGVKSLALFGSAARNQAVETSDLDFLVEFEHKTFDNYMELKFFLEELFGVPVDLVLKDAVKPRLRNAILAEAVYAPGL
ncbi:MAG: nucleotidyltransferase family protein [candidate division WOR-3 bacterium]